MIGSEFNPNKCKVMHFYSRNKNKWEAVLNEAQQANPIKLQTHPVKNADKMQLLGVRMVMV